MAKQMQFYNSSPSMTMLLQPEFCPPPRVAQGWQPLQQRRAPTPPPHAYGNAPARQQISFRARPSSAPHAKPASSSSSSSSSASSHRPPPRPPATRHRPAAAWNPPPPDHQPMHFDVTFTPRPPPSNHAAKWEPRPAPKQARMATGGTLTVYPRVEDGKVVQMPPYDPIYDPYLADYFAKKFTGPRPPSAHQQRQVSWSSTGYGGPNSLTFDKARRFPYTEPPYMREVRNLRKGASRVKKKGDVLYKVTVRTGDQAGAGTDARVFMRIVGRRGKVNKWRLHKKSGQKNVKMFRFAKGTSHLFKHRGPDVGEIQKIVIEHDGVSERDSWFLHEVLVEDTRYNRSYTFQCERWLSLYKEDCQTSRQLTAVSGKQSKRTTYEVTTVTGDKRGAGTDANVFVTMYGSKGTSPKLQLTSVHRGKFERGKSDVFKIRTVNVGKLKKIRVESDNQGRNPAWLLERVVVINMAEPTKRVFFPCGQWLSDEEQLYRDLVGSADPLSRSKMNTYKITTFTGDVRKAGTDAEVRITLFGEKGESGSKLLDNSKNNFERGKKDTFSIECPHVGKLKKIRIGHDNSGSSPGWFLDKVVVDDTMMSQVYTLPCQRWFAKDEDDGWITRELSVGKGDTGIPYTVQVFTGDVRGAGTDAAVYIVMHGGSKGQQSSGKIVLDGKFERKRVDVIQVEVAGGILSPLEKIEIGHDDSGAGPGWYLEKVVVTCNTNGCEQVFMCRKWLASDEGDRLICRELFESKSLRKQVVQKSAWNCTIFTSDVRHAGTDANVFIQVYGDKGKSDVIPLGNESDNFETGQKDKFKIDFQDIGKIYKLRVWHDNAKPASGWHLDKIVLEPVSSSARKSAPAFTFECGRWLDEDEDDGEIIRELAATGPGIKKPQPLVRYKVAVHTGDKRGAGTDAKVFCCLTGEQGDTGDRPLRKSKTNRNKFERKKVDEFVIEAVSLLHVKKVKIGHNDAGPGSGWYLEKVTVCEEGSSQLINFPCARWLATDEDDGAVVRELVEEGSPQLLNTTSYHVSVKTGDVRGAGTDANVFITIYGESGDTGKLKLHTSDNMRSNKFERSRTDLFKLEAADIGKIQRIVVGHDGSNPGAGWFLDGVEIDVPSSGFHHSFKCHRWLATDEGDGKIEIELYPTATRQQDKLLPYEITVTTGDVRGAGTDSNVILQLYGEDGKSEVLPLDNRTDNFERAAVDKFKIEAPDIGPLIKIRIGHDGKGLGSGWFLDSVKIQRFVKKTSKRKKKRRDSVAPDGGQGEIETYWFVCKRWFDKSEDDGQIVRELVPTDEAGRALDEALQEMEYGVDVYTGDKLGAGTDSNVFIILYGENGDSGERKLAKSDNINKFERNQKDSFKLKAADLSDLKKLKIRHDNSGFGDAWFLDRVEVRVGSAGGQAWVFPCQRWLGTNEDDGQIERTLVPVDKQAYARLQQEMAGKKKSSKTAVRDAVALETKAQLTTYEVSVKTGDVRSAGTDANVYMVLYGEKDDSGHINLKSSKTYRDKFERNHVDVFTVDSADLGSLKKIKIGHDNAGFNAGWYLEYVEVDAASLGMKWRFPCGRWLSRDQDDGKLERELLPATDETVGYAAKVPYEIKVYTSDVSSAGTDANVFVVLYGRDGSQTEQTDLCASKDDRKSKFKKKSIDTFVLLLDDIGDKIEKLRIGHDDKGWSSGWHLDKVEVRRLLQGSKKGSETYLFQCARWLARDEDDGEIVREMVPTQVIKEQVSKSGQLKRSESTLNDTLKNQQYRVHVFTGDVFNAGTDANVFLTVFGEQGDTGERKLLKSETNKDKFERGKEDIFNIEAVDLGKPYKLHIRHDNALINPAWFLDRVEIVDSETAEKFVFHCERWLAKGKDDGKIARSLYVVGYDGETSTKRSAITTKSGGSFGRKSFSLSDTIPEGPTIPYKVKVRTGSEEGSTLRGSAFIKIHGPSRKGEGKTTDRISLDPPGGKFKKGTIETFEFEAIDVGSIKKIEVGHSSVDETWFVEDVTVDQPTLGKHFTFACKKWFARERDDGMTTRTLSVADAERTKYQAKVPYEITIYTGDVPQAGTDCTIKLDVFGSKGSVNDLMIVKSEVSGVLLERGSVDVISVEIDDVAPLKMVRVAHDGKGQRADWFCDKIELRNLDSGKVTVFPCQQWLSKSLGDRQVSRELSASVGGRSVLDKTTYKLAVKTSDQRGAGTNANVSCRIFGAHGDTGELRLRESDTHRNKFEKGATDVFTFAEKLSVGELHKLRVWHDSKGFGAGWHLEHIEVHDTTTDVRYMFPCNRWLADDEDDKQTIRDLVCSNPTATDSPAAGTPRGRQKYTVTVATGDKRDAAPGGDAWIVLHGAGGAKSRKSRLENNGRLRGRLERGHKSEFTVECRDLGAVEEITLGLFDEDRWHVDEVTVAEASGGRFVFACRTWLDQSDAVRGKTFSCTNASGRRVSLASLSPVKYEVVVVTADEKGAGTDANVTLTVYGAHGDSGKRALKQRFRDLFERNQTDKFTLEMLDLGELSKIRLEHDDAGFNADWLCDHVTVRNSTSGQTWAFPCREWIGQKKANQLYRDCPARSAT